jgi:DNA primase
MKLEKEHFQRIPEILGLKYKKTPRDDRGFFYCPFHPEEKVPSLSMSFEKGIWNCFSCHKGGTINELVVELTNQNIYQALGLDHEFSGFIKKVVYKEYVEEEIDESKINIDIRGIVVPYNQSPEAVSYLKQRGIEQRIADKYDFKYANDIYINGWKFIKRLMIPIYGETGKLVNIEGRDVTRTNSIKVLYPKNSIKPIWNIQNLDVNKPLYITEGLIDLFLLEQDEYFNNLTVQFGSAISPYQKKMLEKFPTIITIFNNDDAGERSVETLRRELGRKIDKLEFSKEFNDIGEIWENGNMTVKQYRERYGFKLKRDNAFFL